MHADPQRHARECQHGKEPRQTPEDEREREPDAECGERAARQLERTVRGKRRADHARTERGKAETGDALSLRLRDEQERQAEAGDRPAEMREADHRTITAARLT